MTKKILILVAAFLICVYRISLAVTTPQIIDVPKENRLQLILNAKGEQIFQCILDSGQYRWQWQAPNAKLYEPQNQGLVGSHGAGPSWIYKDGSQVKAKVMQKADSPDKDATAWLLLKATEHQGKGVLASVSYIQRINTHGGISPKVGCDANHLGAEKQIPYRADYLFYAE